VEVEVIFDFCDEKKPHPTSPRLRRAVANSRARHSLSEGGSVSTAIH
jgi:hypothetical protein